MDWDYLATETHGAGEYHEKRHQSYLHLKRFFPLASVAKLVPVQYQEYENELRPNVQHDSFFLSSLSLIKVKMENVSV